MEEEVADKRKQPARKRSTGTSARLPDDVLDECEESFIAAQEKVTKASKNYYADTGLMALLCRHDHVLFVANLTSPGERQHYALILLRKLLEALPADWMVGVLYDISCQPSRSIEKVASYTPTRSSTALTKHFSTTSYPAMLTALCLVYRSSTPMGTNGLASSCSIRASERGSGSRTARAASGSGVRCEG